MEGILSGLKPERVFHYFEELCNLPHGSGNVAAVADWLVDFAILHGLACEKDGADNVIIRKPATPGYENAPGVILQGHTDMVCAKDPGVLHDFTKDPLRLVTDGKTVYAEGTTLGGDDGIAVAMMLAVLESTTLAHPSLEAVFTSDEEIGLLGAKALNCERLQGRQLLNLDSEDEGVLTVSCAGGSVTTVTLPLGRTSGGTAFRVTVTGLKGGHSGAEIHLPRANAAILLGEFLREDGVLFVSAEGGSADNAIMPSCQAVVCGENIPALVEKYEAAFRARFPEEVGLRMLCEQVAPSDAAALSLGQFLAEAPYGVQSMSQEIEGLVQTSLNLGILRTEGDHVTLVYSVRSSVEQEKKQLNAVLHELAKKFGGSAVTEGEYPAWEYRKQSPLRERMKQTYERLFGKPLRVEAIHAGLECGLFAGGLPGLDAVSFGPDMRDIHTPRESLSVASVERTFTFLTETLADLR